MTASGPGRVSRGNAVVARTRMRDVTRSHPSPATSHQRHRLDMPPQALHIKRRIAPIQAPLARHKPRLERRVRPRHVAPRHAARDAARRADRRRALDGRPGERPRAVLPEEVVQERFFCCAGVRGRPWGAGSCGGPRDVARGGGVVLVVMMMVRFRGEARGRCGGRGRGGGGRGGGACARAVVEGGGGGAVRGDAVRGPGGLVLRVVVVVGGGADAVDGLDGGGLGVGGVVPFDRFVLLCSARGSGRGRREKGGLTRGRACLDGGDVMEWAAAAEPWMNAGWLVLMYAVWMSMRLCVYSVVGPRRSRRSSETTSTSCACSLGNRCSSC